MIDKPNEKTSDPAHESQQQSDGPIYYPLYGSITALYVFNADYLPTGEWQLYPARLSVQVNTSVCVSWNMIDTSEATTRELQV